MSNHKNLHHDFIVQLMNKGFQRATQAFSVFTGQAVTYSSVQFNMHNQNAFYDARLSNDLYIISTQLIGELSGKSYFIFNDAARKEICEIMNMYNALEASQEGLLMEIDNMISASVISEMSNSLNVEIYGDVPISKRINAADLYEFVVGGSTLNATSDVLFAHTTFEIEKNKNFRAGFVWKLSDRILEVIPAEKLTAN
jgi:chemotaxis protein CheY-P-specific phosphatase CheC